MLGSMRVYFALALVTAVAAAAAACSGGSETQGSSGKDASSGSGGSAASSSSAASGSGGSDVAPTCAPEDNVTLAATELFFGEGNSGEWKKVGWNLDGKDSTAASTDLCKPNSGAAKSTPYPDGEDGIDNSFGKNLLPVILSLYPTWVDDIYNSIQKGFFTSMLKMECLPPKGDAPLLNTKLFGATPLGMQPKWDGTDVWPVAPELLSNPMDPDSSSIVFPQSSVMGSTFDAGNGTFVLTVPLKTQTATTSIKLTLYAAKLRMTLADDRKSSTNGMIGGVLNTEEFVAEVKKVGVLLDLCGTSVLDNVITQVRQASDTMSDGTQDPEQTCDGITMGMGFDMKQIKLGEVGPATPVGMSCP